jgi:hypothetical protein
VSVYEELFGTENFEDGEFTALLRALCSQTDATRQQAEELRALRTTIAMLAGGHETIIDKPGRATYPFCDVCQCHHHPENDHCILRGGRGAEAMFPPTARESQEENAAAAAAALAFPIPGIGDQLQGPWAGGYPAPNEDLAGEEPKS